MQQNKPSPNEWLTKLATYSSGLTSKTEGLKFKLSANESPLGASPNVIAACENAIKNMHLYPDQYSTKLREGIGRRWNLDPARIVCGGGSDELLVLIAKAFLTGGTNAICSEYGFLLFPLVTKSTGAEAIVVQEPSRVSDIDGIVRSINESTKVIWLANPNNPTGTMLNNDELVKLHKQIPEETLLVLDGAYAEFLPNPEEFPGIELAKNCSNVVMTRTFSKLYGLAGMRVGWMYGSQEIINLINALREPYNVGILSQVAAECAVRDTDFEQLARDHNLKWRSWLQSKLTHLGLSVLESHANFLLVDFASEAQLNVADQALRNHSIEVRKAKNYGFANSMRISVGTEEACKIIIDCLTKANLQSVSAK